MIRSRRQNFASLPQALSSDSENTHWNLSATMLSCPWSIWDSFRGIQSHTHNWSFGWITIKIHNKIKYLKVPTYDVDERFLHHHHGGQYAWCSENDLVERMSGKGRRWCFMHAMQENTLIEGTFIVI